MIIVPARVQPACARIVTRRAEYNFHRVSEPIFGQLPVFRIDGAIPKGAAA